MGLPKWARHPLKWPTRGCRMGQPKVPRAAADGPPRNIDLFYKLMYVILLGFPALPLRSLINESFME